MNDSDDPRQGFDKETFDAEIKRAREAVELAKEAVERANRILQTYRRGGSGNDDQLTPIKEFFGPSLTRYR